MELVHVEALKLKVCTRLREGWVVMYGADELIAFVEQTCYPPGTPANGLFEAFVSARPVLSLYLGKKTPELCSFLGDLPDFEDTLGLCFVAQLNDQQAVAMQEIGIPGKLVDDYVESLLVNLNMIPERRN